MTPGSAVRHTSVARHITDCSKRPCAVVVVVVVVVWWWLCGGGGGGFGGGDGNNNPMIVRRLKSLRSYRHIICRDKMIRCLICNQSYSRRDAL